MNIQERATLVYRIMQGKMFYEFMGNKYIIRTPTLDILSSAQIYYNEIIDTYKFDDWLPKDMCERVLIYNGLWNPDKNMELEDLSKQIENCKVNIFKSFFDSGAYEAYKIQLKDLNDQIDKLENIKHSLDYLTLEGLATILHSYFMVAHTCYNLDNSLVFANFPHINFSYLQLIYAELQDCSINIEQIRELARSEPWSQYWRASKSNIFGQNGVQLSSDQRHLILYSQMYDSVSEHSEPPCQDIIDDDDALDGWLISERRKREEERKEKGSKSMTNMHPDAQEVFIPAKTQQDIDRINQLNSVQSKITKAQRAKMIQAKGEVKESQLPDRQAEIKQMMVQAQRNQGHG